MESKDRPILLWLDDYFDAYGEVDSSKLSATEATFKADLVEITRRFPNFDLRSFTTVGSIVDVLCDTARLNAGFSPRLRGSPAAIDAIIIDIMIDKTDRIEIPMIDTASRSILFDEHGGFEREALRTESFNVGIVLARELIRNVSAFDAVPLLFYTNRPIDPPVEKAISDLARIGPAYAINKVGGLRALADLIGKQS